MAIYHCLSHSIRLHCIGGHTSTLHRKSIFAYGRRERGSTEEAGKSREEAAEGGCSKASWRQQIFKEVQKGRYKDQEGSDHQGDLFYKSAAVFLFARQKLCLWPSMKFEPLTLSPLSCKSILQNLEATRSEFPYNAHCFAAFSPLSRLLQCSPQHASPRASANAGVASVLFENVFICFQRFWEYTRLVWLQHSACRG